MTGILEERDKEGKETGENENKGNGEKEGGGRKQNEDIILQKDHKK